MTRGLVELRSGILLWPVHFLFLSQHGIAALQHATCAEFGYLSRKCKFFTPLQEIPAPYSRPARQSGTVLSSYSGSPNAMASMFEVPFTLRVEWNKFRRQVVMRPRTVELTGGNKSGAGITSLRPVTFLIFFPRAAGAGVVTSDFLVVAMDGLSGDGLVAAIEREFGLWT